MPGGTRELSNSSDMPRTSTLASNDIIAGMKANGSPAAFRGSLFLAVAAGWTLAATWAELSSTPGTRSGQPGRVLDDTGTHTDPVSGQVVPNMGEYAWNGSAWRRVGDLEARVGEFGPSAVFAQDWNLITESGVYRSNNSGAAPINGPGNFGYMICEHLETTDGRAFQIAYRTTAAPFAPYFRARDGNGVWSPYQQLLSDTPRSVLAGVMSVRDLTDQYPDPEMEDLSFYSVSGATTISRSANSAGRTSSFYIFHELSTEAAAIRSGLFPAFAGIPYKVTARTSFTTNLPVDRAVYIDWFSDYAGEVLISSSEVSTWDGSSSNKRTAILTAPAGTVRARFRATKAASVVATRVIVSEFSFRRLTTADDILPNTITPTRMAIRDLSNEYPDTEMNDLDFYTISGATNVSRGPNTPGRVSSWFISHPLTDAEVTIRSGTFPAFEGVSYFVSARCSPSAGEPVDRTIYIDWFSDYAGQALISSSEVSTWEGFASVRRSVVLVAPPGTVRARFRGHKDATEGPSRIALEGFIFRRQVSSDDVGPGAILPGAMTTRDYNSYPDPEMEDLTLYTLHGADTLLRFTSSSWPYIFHEELETGMVEIVSPVVPITGDTSYEFSARLSFTTDLPVVRELYIDWYSDLEATELLDSSLFSRWDQYESGLRSVLIRAPGGAVRARLRAVKLPSTNPTRLVIASYSVRPIPMSDVSARYADSRSRRSLEINGNLPRGGDFPTSADQEIETVFGGNTGRQRPPLAAMDLGECMFIPPTEEQLNFTGPTVPHMAWRGTAYRMIPMDIRTSLFSTPVGIPLFNPHVTNNSGVLVFNYLQTDPIHTVLKGSIDMMALVSRDNPDARMRHILGLKGFDTPYLEKGQGDARRFLAQSIPFGDTAKRILDVEAFNDPCAPIDDYILSQFASGSPNLYVGSDHGFLNPISEGWDVDPETGLYLTDDNGPVGPEVQTTKWIDVSSYDPLEHVYAITFDGTSTRSRLQWRDENNEVHYFSGQSEDLSSYRLIRLPRRAKAFRVYYTGRGQTAGDNNVDIRALSGPALDYDPLKGYFQTYRFSVNRDVTFWPGAGYGFFLFQQSFAGAYPTAAETPEWGFRFQSGGLSMMFDAGRIRRTLATSLYRAV